MKHFLETDEAQGPSWKKQDFLVQTIYQRKSLREIGTTDTIVIVATMMENRLEFIKIILMIMHDG